MEASGSRGLARSRYRGAASAADAIDPAIAELIAESPGTGEFGGKENTRNYRAPTCGQICLGKKGSA